MIREDFLFHVAICPVAAGQLVEVHQVRVKLGAIDAGEFDMVAHRDAAACRAMRRHLFETYATAMTPKDAAVPALELAKSLLVGQLG